MELALKLDEITFHTMSCPACGHKCVTHSSIPSMSIVCSSCLSIMDISDPNLVMIESPIQKVVTPRIPLGLIGRFGGDDFIVVGFLKGPEKTDREEYLLVNKTLGYRWLVYSDGHWSVYRAIDPLFERPLLAGGSVDFLGQTYRPFRTARLRYSFAIGEFYWPVRLSQATDTVDYICPPFNLKFEKRGGIESWSIGKYFTPEEISRAFRLVQTLPAPLSVSPNEPSPFVKFLRECASIFVIFVLALLATQIVSMQKGEKIVQEMKMHFGSATSEKTQNGEPFALHAGPHPIRILFNSRLHDHARFGANISLSDINQKTQYTFFKELGHFADDSNKNIPTDEVFLSKVPDGNYFLTVTELAGSSRDADIQVTIKSGARPWSNFMISFLLILAPLLLAVGLHISFEKRARRL